MWKKNWTQWKFIHDHPSMNPEEGTLRDYMKVTNDLKEKWPDFVDTHLKIPKGTKKKASWRAHRYRLAVKLWLDHWEKHDEEPSCQIKDDLASLSDDDDWTCPLDDDQNDDLASLSDDDDWTCPLDDDKNDEELPPPDIINSDTESPPPDIIKSDTESETLSKQDLRDIIKGMKEDSDLKNVRNDYTKKRCSQSKAIGFLSRFLLNIKIKSQKAEIKSREAEIKSREAEIMLREAEIKSLKSWLKFEKCATASVIMLLSGGIIAGVIRQIYS